MKEVWDEREFDKVNDIVVIEKKLRSSDIKKVTLISRKNISMVSIKTINVQGTIDQRDFPEFDYMVDGEFFEHVRKIYENIPERNDLDKVFEKIKEILTEENSKMEEESFV